MVVKAVLFDFWGTLIENGTYSPLKQSYSILRLRIPFGDFVERFERALMTSKFNDQAAGFVSVCKEFRVPTKPIIIEKLIGVWNKNKLLAKPFSDTIPALEMLKDKGVKLAIVTNAPQNSVEDILDKFKLTDYFDGVFVSAERGALKTDNLFEIALDELGVSADEALMVGDSIESDIKGAEKASIKAILVDRRDSRDFTPKITTLTAIEEEL